MTETDDEKRERWQAEREQLARHEQIVAHLKALVSAAHLLVGITAAIAVVVIWRAA
jgi:hypothetical protein